MLPMLIAALATLALLAGPAASAQTPKRGGTLRIATEGEAFDLNPIGISGALKVYREIMGGALLRLDENFNPIGDLAESWEVSEDGRVVTFKLHPGGTYHDGTSLDAESVKWNLDIVSRKVVPKWVQEREKKDPKYKWQNLFINYLYHIDKVEVVNKYTLRVHQKDKGKGQLIDAMTGTLARFVLVSPKAYDMDIEKFRRHPVLSGPYKFVEWKRNQHLFAERHKGFYRKGQPYLDRIEFYFIPDANQRMNALIGGQIDVINNLPLSLHETMKKVPGAVVHRGRATINYAFPFNNQMDPWKDIRVRKAISCYGVDRAQVVKTALRGLAKPWATFAPGGAVDALDLTAECPYDPEKAKKLLAEAGYGPGKPLKFTMTTNNSDPAHIEVSQALKLQFAKFGAVGTLNSFIDLGVLNVLNLVSGIPADKLSNLMFGTFKTISFLLATTNSYLWNKNWTFGDQGRSQAATVFKFYAITALNWVLNVGVATGVKALGPVFGTAELWVNVVAPLAGIFAGLLGNFLGYKYLVFKKEEPKVSS